MFIFMLEFKQCSKCSNHLNINISTVISYTINKSIHTLILYLIGYPKPCPFLTKASNAAALHIKPMPANIVSIASKINVPKDLKRGHHIFIC